MDGPVVECMHGLEDYSCVFCKPKQKGQDITIDFNGYVAAKYDGHCNSCNLPIYEGDYITHDGTNWVHADC